MEAFGSVLPRPVALFSAGCIESVCQRKSMKIISSREVSKKLAWSRGISNSAFLDLGHLDYYNSDRLPEIRCRKVFAGEKKMKKKDSELKEKNKKRIKMLKGLSRDLFMLSKSGFGLDSSSDNIYLDREVKPEMISDALVALQGEMKQLSTREKELKMKSKEQKNRLKVEETRNFESEMLSSCSSESSDSECNSERTDVLLHSVDIGMQEDIVMFLQGQLQQLQNKEEVKQKRKEEKRRMKAERMQKLDDCSSSESSDSECEQLSNTNALSCYPLLAEKIPSGLPPAVSEVAVLHRDLTQVQSGNGLQESTATLSSIFQSTEVLNDNLSRVNNFERACSTEIIKNLRQDSELAGSTKRIEVCMGGKCKKSGAVLLMEEFQRQFGIEGAVSGCKCMGKCKNGPNVRVVQSDDSLAGAAANPLCLSVGLDDVSSILANFLGESGLPAAASYGEI